MCLLRDQFERGGATNSNMGGANIVIITGAICGGIDFDGVGFKTEIEHETKGVVE